MAVNDPRIGSRLGGYRIEALIGRGGMGVVYRAEDLRLGRKVALKLLAPELAANESFRARFESESRLAAAIDHPHIIPLYEAGEFEGLLFLVMRFVDGIDLKALIDRDGPMSLQRALAMVAQIASALDAAHARGLVHRDVKPANVLVSSLGGADISQHCYLTDFGLTKDTSQNKGVTRSGQFVGTTAYVAPEQIEGATLSGASDQYALGCMLFELLTGHPPFWGGTELDVMWAHLRAPPPAVTAERPDLPPALDAVLARALAKAADDRYPSCAAMLAAARGTMLKTTVGGRTVAAPTRALTETPRRSPPPVAEAPEPPATAVASTAWAAVRWVPARRRELLAVAVALLGVGLAGAVAGGSARKHAPRPGNVAATGALSLRFSEQWGILRAPPSIPGLRFEDRIALGPRAARGREGLLAGRIRSSGARLLPAKVVSGAAREVVRLGPVEAFRYSGLRPVGFTGSVTVYLILTDQARAAIACYASRRPRDFDRRCARVAGSVRLIGAKALTLVPSSRYASALNELLSDIARQRATGRRRLAEAVSTDGQARAAGALAVAYAQAQRRALELPVPGVALDANAAIVDALRDLVHAYETAFEAVRRRRAGLYRSADRGVKRGENSLRAAVTRLAELGYDVS